MFTVKQHQILSNLVLDRANDHCVAAAVREFMAEPAYNEELTFKRLLNRALQHDDLIDLAPAVRAVTGW
jgi:hypothetical protein